MFDSVNINVREIELAYLRKNVAVYTSVCGCLCVYVHVDGVRSRIKGPSLPIQSSRIAFTRLNTLYWQLPPCN